MQPIKLFISPEEVSTTSFISMINPLIFEEEVILKYLYVKQHSVTKLMYFGMTCEEDPIKYQGSGKYWQRHIKNHGGKKFIKTLCIWAFNNQEDSTNFALEFSEVNDIVKSNMWANLRPENALDGMTLGYKHSDITRENHSIARKQRFSDPIERQKQRDANLKRYSDPEERRKSSEAQRNRSYENEEIRRQRISENWNNKTHEEKEIIKQKQFLGNEKRYSDPESRRKSSEIRTGNKRYNNGKINKWFKEVQADSEWKPGWI